MLMGTLKETLIFVQDDGTGCHRYEIYKSDHQGGYFAVIYVQKTVLLDDVTVVTWVIDNPHWHMKSHYIPNARMECESHWKATYRILIA
ncbi:hypothetical protein JMY81_03390 [Brenneria goodwinii]|uniref:hypothetical protein n=1 Tax=Brenneria goodwinii TaxID=1109412 RepID=UPI00065DC282|nr:hypothetical protein [Brenneria goodwinii]MCG8154782.1 hypothetical protein [Brenneria goodwinii]MCG8159881.1 hypothetical protein [Brenneria goodwinii]MCG8164020.1 hypothetical protein [Brenneria goodwinii]MCG8168629.1 hypothetical protein [Brenneria goodwinii]MCG8173816.1 hypothetical protein [Brenneria goodwinii]